MMAGNGSSLPEEYLNVKITTSLHHWEEEVFNPLGQQRPTTK